MTAIGGKTKKAALPSAPQFAVQRAIDVNEFALFSLTEKQDIVVSWVGDPNAATKFSSKYNAKMRVRDIENIPDTRAFKEIEGKAR